MIGEILKSLIGLFLDDGFLAVAVLSAVAFVGALLLTGMTPAWVGGLALALALPAALALSVVRTARHKRSFRDP